jgi:hypothetical protein
MTCQPISANFSTDFSGRENIFAADANMPQIRPQICRICHRKYCRKCALTRKAVEPRNLAHTTRDMARKHRPAKSFLLPFGNSPE